MDSQRPLMLGVVGDHAAGKTTLVRGVVRLLAHNGVTPICLDDYYRYERRERAWRGLTENDPDAHDLSLVLTHLTALRAGDSIRKPVYDHRSGMFRDPELVVATDLVIAYGLLTLNDPQMQELFDLSIYLDPHVSLRLAWQMDRDTSSRGYTSDQMTALAPARERDAERFIHRQRALADLVIRVVPQESSGLFYEVSLRRNPALAAAQSICEQLARKPIAGIHTQLAHTDSDGLLVDILQIANTLSFDSEAQFQAYLPWNGDSLSATTLARIGTIGERTQQQRSSALALVQLLIASLLAAQR